MLFLTNFGPLPPVTLCNTSRDPPKVRHTSRTPLRFLVVQKTRTKTPLYKVSLNGSWGFCSGFCSGFFVWKALSAVLFVHTPSARIPPLQQKVNHHFQFHVSYV